MTDEIYSLLVNNKSDKFSQHHHSGQLSPQSPETLPVMSIFIQNIIDSKPVPTNMWNLIVATVISLEVFRQLIVTAPIEKELNID